MKSIKYLVVLAMLACVTLTACTHSKPGGTRETGFAGKFTDEFGNKFVLNDDYTATIQFVGSDSVINTTWLDGADHQSPYATIMFNSDPAYYYLRDGFLYRHLKDMQEGTLAIKIEYEE